jgi:hypothetical protein
MQGMDGEIVIIEELCTGGDLFDLMSKGNLKETEMKRHFADVVRRGLFTVVPLTYEIDRWS